MRFLVGIKSYALLAPMEDYLYSLEPISTIGETQILVRGKFGNYLRKLVRPDQF